MDKILKSIKLDKQLVDLIDNYCKLTKSVFGNNPTFTHIVNSGIESYLLEQINNIKLIHSGNGIVFSEIGEKKQLALSETEQKLLIEIEESLIIRHFYNNDD